MYPISALKDEQNIFFTVKLMEYVLSSDYIIILLLTLLDKIL